MPVEKAGEAMEVAFVKFSLFGLPKRREPAVVEDNSRKTWELAKPEVEPLIVLVAAAVDVVVGATVKAVVVLVVLVMTGVTVVMTDLS